MAEEISITGNWLMMKAEIGDKVKESYLIMEFTDKGVIKIMGIRVGSWELNDKRDKIIMKSSKFRKLNGENKILKLTDKELILEKEGVKIYYLKIDKDAIKKINKDSKLTGVWKINTNDGTFKYIKFEKPDKFLFMNIDGGMSESVNGNWIFNPKDKTVILISFSPVFRGKRKILKINSKEFIWENNGISKRATKQFTEENSIERLLFKETDFPEENKDEEKLPWREFQDMLLFLNNIKSVKYKKSVLINELNVFVYSEILSEIDADINKEKVKFTNYIINGGIKKQYSENYKGGLTERYNYFFPKNELFPYRIKGVETIEVPAGKFKCTVVEGFDGETKVKYWMINDKPGIYAKIIMENSIASGKLVYSVYELLEIEE
jgi:hypothetical protein